MKVHGRRFGSSRAIGRDPRSHHGDDNAIQVTLTLIPTWTLDTWIKYL